MDTLACNAWVLQGPDAVTFENLSLAHFLDKADQLAACAEKVKALNAQVWCQPISFLFMYKGSGTHQRLQAYPLKGMVCCAYA